MAIPTPRTPIQQGRDVQERIEILERRLLRTPTRDISGLIEAGDNVTLDGSGILADPYVVNAEIPPPPVIPERPFAPTDWVGHLGTPLLIPTHLSPAGGQTTHPSVLYFPGAGWNGYRYWMAHTPYPGGSDAAEDPNICAGQDGDTWVVPAGLTNPLDDQPGSPGAYNSDTEIVMTPDGLTMILVWRTFNPATVGGEEQFWMRTSTNGTTWTTKVMILQNNMATRRLMSPTLVFENGAWTMWAVDILPSPNRVVRLRSTGPTITGPSSWGAPVNCTVDYVQAGKEPWHLQVRKVRDQYVSLLTDCTLDISGTNGDILMWVSDDGLAWRSSRRVSIPRLGAMHNALYRGSIVVMEDGSGYTLDTWYAAWTTSPQVWNVFRTSIAPEGLIGRDTGWISLTQPAGFTDLDGMPSAYRIVGKTVHIRVSISGTLVSGTVYNITGLPILALPLGDVVRVSGVANSLQAALMVPNRGHGSAGIIQVQQLTGANRTWASGRFSYEIG